MRPDARAYFPLLEIGCRAKWFSFTTMDYNPIREENHSHIESQFRMMDSRVTVLQFAEGDAVGSLRANMEDLARSIDRAGSGAIVMDISVFTKLTSTYDAEMAR